MGLMENMGLVQKQREIKPIDVNLLVEHPDNFYDVSDVTELKQAIVMAGGVRQNLIVEPIDNGKYRIVSGHRRCKAVKELLDEHAGIPATVPCEIETDPNVAQLLLITTNSSTRKLTAWERIEQYKLPGRKREALAKLLQEGPTNVARLKVISDNKNPALVNMLKQDRIGISAAYELCKLPPDVQEEFCGQAKYKVTLADVKEYINRKYPPTPAPAAELAQEEAAESEMDAGPAEQPTTQPAAEQETTEPAEPKTKETPAEAPKEAVDLPVPRPMPPEKMPLRNPVQESTWRAYMKDQKRPKKYIDGKGNIITQEDDKNIRDYIGVDDKHGNPIFEGDMLQDDDGERMIVFFDKEATTYGVSSYDKDRLEGCTWYPDADDFRAMEIIEEK
ncbi:ParB/RepB/Spo0J family partition protein [Megasphaera elsdenii]|uniref:ParB/RepB/Spo0J family partition protein n=1 Tax=Megasphaera elsdenii TaxID=907 RepID=UPI00265E08E8|nr:YopX family protein [Megasphaera elsdenii]